MSRSICVVASAVLVAGTALTAGWSAAAGGGRDEIRAALGRARVPFVENRSQLRDSRVAYLAETFAATVVVERSGAVAYQIGRRGAGGVVIREHFSSEAGTPRGVGPSEVKVSYFRGRDPKAWQSDLPCFDAISYGEISPGVSLLLQAHHDNVEKIFTVAPGADPSVISVRIEGGKELGVGPSGELELRTQSGPVTFSAPIAYQEIGGANRPIDVAYALHGDAGYGFEVGDYDATRPLVIDPIIASTYIGRQSTEVGLAIAADLQGNVYVAGHSKDHSSPNPYQTTAESYSATILGGIDIYFGDRDAVVSKFDPTLGQLLASTFVGGTSVDGATSLAIEIGIEPGQDDRIVVAGLTSSDDFPTTANAFDEEHNGSSDVFVLRLSDDLSSLLASTVVGGSHMESAFEPGTDRGPDMAIDAAGDIYVAGTTYSSDFPIIPEGKDEGYAPFQGVKHGDDDAFVIKLSNDLTALLGWTYLGGGNNDRGTAVAVDAEKHVFVSGHTESAEDWEPPPYQAFPITPFAFDPSHNSRAGVVLEDGFVSRFDTDLEMLEASTFLGGGAEDLVWDMAVDDQHGWVYVTGGTGSLNFPTSDTAYLPERYAAKNGFVAKLDSALTELAAGTYLGGVGEGAFAETSLYGIALDDFGTVWVTGYTYDDYQPTFPVTIDLADPDLPPWYDPFYYAWRDVVLSRFDRHLRRLHTSLHVGGSYPQESWSVFTRSFRHDPPQDGEPAEEDYVEVYVTGWSEAGTPNDQFYPVFYNDSGFVNSYDYFADNDDLLVTTFRVVPEPGSDALAITALAVLALIAARTRRGAPAP